MKYFNAVPNAVFAGALLCLASLFSHPADAGGITLGASRVVYPANAQQATISLSNKSDNVTYLMQSWVETADGKKTSDFFVTPPLYTSAPGNENMLRIMSTGTPHASGKESLYYLNIKAIPSVDKNAMEKEGGGLVVATQMQIKLFVRPEGLTPDREKAADALEFTRKGAQLVIHNPTPYYLTLTDMKAGSQPLKDVMVAPQASETLALPAGSANTVNWVSVNDYGGLDKGQNRIR
ncbi:fimbrial biogenesis chaperone [Enterobacter chuandaensis]|uniref:fimbrial biogenesis chaperone n=1 Tax=Enterobacter chuandaensis TaxID=2497875 RepID=UPI001C2EAF76|nr:fimbria/pilus periplasmic chaperone [Enterobacter chuandaensis]